ncbi:MAG: hypothetical protein RIS84_637 [Pseudomonadota bacterium]
MPTSSLQRRGFYKLMPYNETLIDSTVSCLELSPFWVEYATLFHPTTKLSTLPYPELRLDACLAPPFFQRGNGSKLKNTIRFNLLNRHFNSILQLSHEQRAIFQTIAKHDIQPTRCNKMPYKHFQLMHRFQSYPSFKSN